MVRYLIILLTLTTLPLFAQPILKPRVSPIAIAAIKYKDAYIKVTYSQPQKNGREIFGKLVPFEKVWRTGANEATEITATKNILVAGKLLKAGTYSIFTIPRKDKWTVIINSDLGLWGAYNYNPEHDVMRVDVPSSPIDDVVYEPFTITFEQRNDLAELLMLWDKTQIAVPIQIPSK